MSVHLYFANMAIVVCQTVTTLAAAEPTAAEARKAGWVKLLNGIQYRLPENYSGVLASLRHFDGNAKVHVVFDPKDKWKLEYKFVRDGREVLSVQGHDQSAFAAEGDTLFFAKYGTSDTGCTVVAYDLSSGEELWQTELHHAKPLGHSLYRNLVTLRISNKGEGGEETAGAAIVVTGMESYCDYVEVLDRQTGESLAIKNYRIGFGPPPPPGGGFGGEGNATRAAGDKTGKK